MEMGFACEDVIDFFIFEVKIRPFRYGNKVVFPEPCNPKIPLKSDRFGMEIIF